MTAPAPVAPPTEHVPSRPSWECLACENPWPCDPVREELMLTHTPTERAIYLWAMLEDAILELPPASYRYLTGRFLTWDRGRE
jgi:hypothetical protein